MDILITHGASARIRSMHIRPLHLWLIVGAISAVMVALSGLIYHFVFLTAVRDGWPVVSQLVRPILREEVVARERYTQQNLDAMAHKVGEMQAKLIRLEAVSARVSGLAGLKPDDLKALNESDKAVLPAVNSASAPKGPQGGPFVSAESPSFEQLHRWVDEMNSEADLRGDVFTLVESRLLERKLGSMLIPSIAPVEGPVGSSFGFRWDPFTGRAALHTGLDFPAPTGTLIRAAAGGKVVLAESKGAYGNAIEIDHGKGLVTRYAHTSAYLVGEGDIVKRGQPVAKVGSTGRSTGPHLHFEVLLNGVHQNPSRFLAQGEGLSESSVTAEAQPSRERAGGRR